MSAIPSQQFEAVPTASAPVESAQVRALLQLRELILSGELAGGTRIAELAIVERLGMSRTPIRAALVRLEQEGLLQALPHGGYVVQRFSENDVADAIELRGTLEGLLARRAAERGAPATALREAREVLSRISALLAAPRLDEQAFSDYVDCNSRFHVVLAGMADSATICRQLDRVNSLPFASPSGFVLARTGSTHARDMLVVAQHQHLQVLDAIERREGARAESIMREHARLAQRNLNAVLAEPPADTLTAAMPAISLIQRRP